MCCLSNGHHIGFRLHLACWCTWQQPHHWLAENVTQCHPLKSWMCWPWPVALTGQHGFALSSKAQWEMVSPQWPLFWLSIVRDTVLIWAANWCTKCGAISCQLNNFIPPASYQEELPYGDCHNKCTHGGAGSSWEPKRPKAGGKEDIQWEMGYCENKIFNLTLKASKHEIMDEMGQTSMVLFFNMQGRTLQKSWQHLVSQAIDVLVYPVGKMWQ